MEHFFHGIEFFIDLYQSFFNKCCYDKKFRLKMCFATGMLAGAAIFNSNSPITQFLFLIPALFIWETLMFSLYFE